MRDIDHVAEIDRVLKGLATGRDGVVADSWRRCVESYGMDPTRAEPAHIVTAAELREHRQEAERLIAIARSGLQALFRQVAGQNYVLLLANAKGVTVDFFGDPRFEDELRAAGLYLGSHWSENLAGTCGVGACIVTGGAVTIHQSDHFGLAHTPLSCTAAPIYDTCGSLAAVLDISLLRSPTPKASQNLAMNLVRASARRVEMANLMGMTRRDWVLRFSSTPEFLEVDPEAAVALDGSGRIIGVTGAARGFLAPEEADLPLIGQRIDALMDLTVDDLPDLMRGRPTEERVLRLKDGRGLFGHAIAPQVAHKLTRRTSHDLPGALSSFSGPDPALQRLLAEAARLAPTRVPLLIAGETGTGKERLARAIHVCGAGNRPFRHVVCTGLDPAELAGPLSDLRGPATLFLDSPEDLGPEAQAALLSVLSGPGDLRVISASCGDLSEACQKGGFRGDLFFRLAGVTLRLPPLRYRRDFDWLLDRLLARRNAGDWQLSPAARAELKARAWPGNIRELEHALDVAVALAEGRVIDVCELPPPAMAPAARPQPDDDLHAVLAASDWNMARAARRLGVNRSTVMRRMRRLGLTLPD